MLRDRYEPQNLFEMVAALSLKMEPVLARLDKLLDDDVLFQEVRADLAQRYPHTQQTGRPSTPVEVHPAHDHRQAPLWLELRTDRVQRQRQPGAAPVLSGLPGTPCPMTRR